MSKARWLEIEQGSKKWLSLREGYFTASEADAMMGTSKYKTRTDLLIEKKTGKKPEVSDYLQRIFDRGHELEESGRQLIEEIVGVPLEPYTVIKGDFLASLDGASRDNNILWEHKTLNNHLRSHLRKGVVPDSHKWQLVHQCMVTDINTVLFMASGEDDYEYAWFTCTQDDIDTLLVEWDKFIAELEVFEVPEETEQTETVSVGDYDLPAIVVEQTEEGTLAYIKPLINEVKAIVSGYNTELVTDDDFARAEKAVKAIKDGESHIQSQLDLYLNEIPEILFTIDSLKGAKQSFAKLRLTLDKQVKGRKQAIKDKAIGFAITELTNYCQEHDLEVKHSFEGAIKNKRTESSMNKAIAAHLAECKASARPTLAKSIDTWANKNHVHEAVYWDLIDILQDYGVLT